MTVHESLQREIEETWSRFFQLLDSIPDEAFVRSSGNPSWNIGEVIYHMSLAPRRLSRQFLADEYDRAHRKILEALWKTSETDLQKTLEYPDWDPLLSDAVSMERLFHYVKAHFDSHEEQIRKALEVG